MKPVTMFMMATCPYCKAALNYQKELQEEHPELAAVTITQIDERLQPELAEQYDYYYVPCYYVDDQKLHEGAATKEAVQSVLTAALDA